MYTLIQHISSVRVAGHGCQFKSRHACIYFVHKECYIFLLQQTVASETCLLIVQPLCFGRPSLDFIVWRFHGGGSSQTSERSCSLFLSHHSVLSAPSKLVPSLPGNKQTALATVASYDAPDLNHFSFVASQYFYKSTYAFGTCWKQDARLKICCVTSAQFQALRLSDLV